MHRSDLERFVGRLAFRHLRMLVAIAEERHLVGAAQRLNMTQSAITKALQETEALLGEPLFDRTNRGVIPTIFGQALIIHARLVLTQLGHAAEELADLKDGTGGRVAVGTLHAASASLLPSAIAALRKERPKVVVSICEGTDDLLLPALRVGELDFIVGRFPEGHPRADLLQETLLLDVACIVVRIGHPLETRGPVRLRDLLAWDWILPRQETTLRRQLDEAFRCEGIDPPAHSVESVSLLTNLGLLTEADYLSVWPWQVANAEAEAGRVSILPIALPTTAGPIGVTTRRGARLSPASEQLLEMLRSVARRTPRCPLLTAIPDGKSRLTQTPLCSPGGREMMPSMRLHGETTCQVEAM